MLAESAVPPPQQKFLPFSLSMVTTRAHSTRPGARSADCRDWGIASAWWLSLRFLDHSAAPRGDAASSYPGARRNRLRPVFKSGGSCSTDNPQIVHLLAGVGRTPRDESRAFHFEFEAIRSTMLARGSEPEATMEKNVDNLLFEFRSRQKIALEARLDAFTGAEYGHPRA